MFSAMHARIHNVVVGCPNKSKPAPLLEGSRLGYKISVYRPLSPGFFLDYKPSGTTASKNQRSAHLVARASEGSSDQALVPVKEGYMVFELEGCEFLVAQDTEGALILSNTFVTDLATGKSTRVSAADDIPSNAAFYQPIEWAAEYYGNVFEGKEPKRWVRRIYLVRVASKEPFLLTMEEVYLLEAATRSLTKLPVKRLAPEGTSLAELRARIRDKEVVIDTAASIPTPEGVVRCSLAGVPALSVLEREALNNQEVDSQAYDLTEKEEEYTAVNAVREEKEDMAQQGGDDVLYDDDMLKDFLVEIDDDDDSEFDEFDMPATDY